MQPDLDASEAEEPEEIVRKVTKKAKSKAKAASKTKTVSEAQSRKSARLEETQLDDMDTEADLPEPASESEYEPDLAPEPVEVKSKPKKSKAAANKAKAAKPRQTVEDETMFDFDFEEKEKENVPKATRAARKATSKAKPVETLKPRAASRKSARDNEMDYNLEAALAQVEEKENIPVSNILRKPMPVKPFSKAPLLPRTSTVSQPQVRKPVSRSGALFSQFLNSANIGRAIPKLKGGRVGR